MSELKPCPFCGGDSVTLQSLGGHTRAGCVDCGAEVTRPMGLYRNAMIEWNTRPIEDALRKRIAELEGENKKAFDFVKTLRTYCIYAHWDNPDTEGEFNEFDVEICKWLSEFTERER